MSDHAFRRHAFRDGVTLMISSLEASVIAGFCAATGGLPDGDCSDDDDVIPSAPSAEVLNCKFDPAPLSERVVQAATLPTFLDWKEDAIIDDLAEAILPPD